MRNTPLIVAVVALLLTLGASVSANAQQQDRPTQSDAGQSVPDGPQPQKKPSSKPQSSPGSSASSSPPASSDAPPKAVPPLPAAKDNNPFPESVSRAAAKAASDASASGESSSAGHSASTAPDTTKHSAADDNPFPESVSRQAAKAAGNSSDSNSSDSNSSDSNSGPQPAGKSDLPPGVSSSRSTGSFGATENEPGGPPQVTDPVRAKKDTQVGGFYLQTGDYQGASLRYKEAIAFDPTNVEAIFGLAEAQRMLKQNAEAARNYQLYLDILPNGPKTKQALKALKALGSGK